MGKHDAIDALLRKYCEAAASELATIEQRRMLIETTESRYDSFKGLGVEQYLLYVSKWSINEILMAIARALDEHKKVASAPCCLKDLKRRSDQIAEAIHHHASEFYDGGTSSADAGLDVRIKRYGVRHSGSGGGLAGTTEKLKAIGKHLEDALMEMDAALKSFRKERHNKLAHTSMKDPPKVNLIWADVTKVQNFLVMYTDCLIPMYEGGGSGWVKGGKFSVYNLHRPSEDLERLLDRVELTRTM